jgi:hypothetical protein
MFPICLVLHNLIKGVEIGQIILKRGVEGFLWLHNSVLFCNQVLGSLCNLLFIGWKPVLGLS